MFREAVLSFLLATTLVVVVRGSDSSVAGTTGRCFRDDRCTDETEVMTVRECCVDNPEGRGFNLFDELCRPCVVFGWNVVNRSLIEQGAMHRLTAEYIKGGLGNTPIGFTVVDTGTGTAVEGPDRDYTLSTRRITLRPGMPSLVDVIFRSDSVALEPPETVNLQLVPDPGATVPTGEGVFCIDELQLTILDHDVLMIELTEDDYRAGEQFEAITVRVRKNFRIATPITFTISPVTLQQARDVRLFPGSEEDLPSNNSNRSPIDANALDFNTTNLTLVFAVDEDAMQDMNELPISIDIFDDELNEATEQDFVAILTVETVISPDSFQYDRRSSLCRIIDNDPIRIGFELNVYTFPEPQFEDVVEVFLATENGVMSEQIFAISLTVSNVVPDGSGFGVADRGVDYDIQPIFDVDFLPFRLRLPISFDLFPDNTPEPTEAFLISSSPNVEPSFLSPSSPLFQRTFVVIEDDDVIIRIGFENTSYTVDESVGSQQICVRIFVEDNIELPLGDGLFVAVATVAGTADETDYTRIDPTLGTVVLIFTNTTRRLCFDLFITDDMLVEGEEQLTLRLSEDPFAPAQVSVEFAPNVTAVTITDTDEAVIGFFETDYVGLEADGYVTVNFGLISGGVQAPVEVMLSLSNGTALEGADYLDSDDVFVFDRSTITVSYNLTLVDDNIAELNEDFTAMLSFVDASVERVSINPEMADVIIVDNDRVTIGLEQPSYTVNEGDGSVMVCAAIVSGTLERTLTFRLTTQDDSATSPADYSSTSVDLTFDESTSRACADIPIEDDLDVENLENFTVIVNGSDSFVDFLPSTSTVTIVDNDIIQVTLDPTPAVSVPETEGSLTMCVQISSPPADAAIEREPFFVSLSTMEGTARDPSDYMGVDLSTFGPFSGSMRRQCVMIPIVLDSEAEQSETFTVNLSEEVDGVVVAPGGAMTTVTIVDSIRRINDSVIGDPLMTVPIYLPDTSVVPELKENEVLSLCYEVHGEADTNFNLVSDQCVSVNARYTQVRPTEAQNIISAIYVRAVDNAGACRNITVNLDSCSTSVDGAQLAQTDRLNQMGISVRPYTNRVRIAVPNCQDLDLVMWVICEERTFWSSELAADGSEITFQAEMIKFVIARGLNLQESSHGILGQFWNIPISLSPITIPGSAQSHYTVEVEYPGGEKRSFVGMLWPLTWEYREAYCLYVGNGQAGPLDEADTGGGPNDPVIEGDYSEYRIESGFGTSFEYAHFDETLCG